MEYFVVHQLFTSNIFWLQFPGLPSNRREFLKVYQQGYLPYVERVTAVPQVWHKKGKLASSWRVRTGYRELHKIVTPTHAPLPK